jgi:hypothetical protein
LSNTSSIATVTAALNHRCYPYSSTPSSYSVLIFSAANIIFQLTEGFVGQIEEVQKNCFRKVRIKFYLKKLSIEN